MKLIIAVIAPENLEAVETALHKREARLMSVSQVLGGGQEPGCTTFYRGAEFHVRRPKLRLEITVDDWLVDAAVEAVVRAGSIGNSGRSRDSKVCVMSLDDSVTSAITKEDRWSLEHEMGNPW